MKQGKNIVKCLQILSSIPDFEIIFFCSDLTQNKGASQAEAQEVLHCLLPPLKESTVESRFLVKMFNLAVF